MADDPRTFRACVACEDGGFVLYRCDGGSGSRGLRDTHLKLSHCGRRVQHLPHSYAERCPCVDTNPVILSRRERDAKRKAESAA